MIVYANCYVIITKVTDSRGVPHVPTFSENGHMQPLEQKRC